MLSLGSRLGPEFETPGYEKVRVRNVWKPLWACGTCTWKRSTPQTGNKTKNKNYLQYENEIRTEIISGQ